MARTDRRHPRTAAAARPTTPPASAGGTPTGGTTPMECTNNHPLQAGWIKCPVCGADPKPTAVIKCQGTPAHDMQPGWVMCPIDGKPPIGAVIKCQGTPAHDMQPGWVMCPIDGKPPIGATAPAATTHAAQTHAPAHTQTHTQPKGGGFLAGVKGALDALDRHNPTLKPKGEEHAGNTDHGQQGHDEHGHG